MTEAELINIIAVLYDVQQCYIKELSLKSSQSLKFYTKKADSELFRLIKIFGKTLKPENYIRYGEAADLIRDFISEMIETSKTKFDAISKAGE